MKNETGVWKWAHFDDDEQDCIRAAEMAWMHGGAEMLPSGLVVKVRARRFVLLKFDDDVIGSPEPFGVAVEFEMAEAKFDWQETEQ